MIIDIFAYLKHCEILQSTATEAQCTPGIAVALKLPLNVHCHMSQELEDYMLDTRLLSGRNRPGLLLQIAEHPHATPCMALSYTWHTV